MAYSPTGEIFNASDQRRFENMMKLLLFLEAELQLKEEIIDLLLVCIVQFWYYFYLVYLKVAKVYTVLPIARFERAMEETLMLHIVHWKVQDSFNHERVISDGYHSLALLFPYYLACKWFSASFFAVRVSRFFSPLRSRKYKRPYCSMIVRTYNRTRRI